MRLLQTLQRRARQRLRLAEPSPRHSPKPPCVSDSDHRSNAPLAIGIALGLALGHAPPTLWAQSQTSINSEAISVNYGRVTQHYQTRWSDPTLPAGVLRGQPPLCYPASTKPGPTQLQMLKRVACPPPQRLRINPGKTPCFTSLI